MPETLTAMLVVGSAGAIGALSRWGASNLVQHWLGGRFAWGTLAVNVVGCFLLGMVMEARELFTLSERMRLLLATGFLGAFTTYSTFGLETFRYIELGTWHKAAANMTANLVLGLAAVWLGVVVMRWYAGRF